MLGNPFAGIFGGLAYSFGGSPQDAFYASQLGTSVEGVLAGAAAAVWAYRNFRANNELVSVNSGGRNGEVLVPGSDTKPPINSGGLLSSLPTLRVRKFLAQLRSDRLPNRRYS